MTDQADGRELVLHQRASVTQRVRGQFDSGQMDLIRATVASDCNPAELAMFLEICGRYELDPFSKQIWAMKIKGKVQIVVSRDGMLALANRHTPAQGYRGPGEFRGCESDVVRENDYFRKFRSPEGTEVEHEYRDAEGKPTASKVKRGNIIGAWAIVHRLEHKPTYFFAEWDTYKGTNVWSSHPEAMMQKVPETMALRKAFSITGVVGESEVEARTNLSETSAAEAEVHWPEDAEMRKRLEEGFEMLGYRRAKILTLVNSCAGEASAFDALLAQLSREVDQRVADTPEEPAEAEVVG